MGLTYVWDEKQGKWREVFRSENEEELQRRIALSLIPTVPPELRPLDRSTTRRGDQLISAVRSLRSGRIALNVGPRARDWAAVAGVNASLGTMDLLREADGRILVVSSLDLYRLAGESPSRRASPCRCSDSRCRFPAAIRSSPSGRIRGWGCSSRPMPP